MKTLGRILLLTGLILTQAQAAEFTCMGDNNEELNLSFTDLPARLPTILAKGSLKTLELEDEVAMSGSKLANYYGNQLYFLNTSDGIGAALNFSVVKTFGGRCGRCTDTGDSKYYAKLLYKEKELDFECHLKLSL